MSKSNDIENNTWYGVWSGDESDPVINYNNIANNGGGATGPGYGVYNDDDEIEIDAQNNWWNDALGPKHIDNPWYEDTNGDRASDDVDYDPWLDEPV